MAETAPMPMCPMAKTCGRMMEKPMSGLILTIPGIVFIAVGALILIEPAILVWLVAAASIVLGIVILALANFVRKVGARVQQM